MKLPMPEAVFAPTWYIHHCMIYPVKRANFTVDRLRRIIASLQPDVEECIADRCTDYLMCRADGKQFYNGEWHWGTVCENASTVTFSSPVEDGTVIPLALDVFNAHNIEWRLPQFQSDCLYVSLLFDFDKRLYSQKFAIAMRMMPLTSATFAFGSIREHLQHYVEMALLSPVPLPADYRPERFLWPFMFCSDTAGGECLSSLPGFGRAGTRWDEFIEKVRIPGASGVSLTSVDGVEFGSDDSETAAAYGLQSLLAIPLRERCWPAPGGNGLDDSYEVNDVVSAFNVPARTALMGQRQESHDALSRFGFQTWPGWPFIDGPGTEDVTFIDDQHVQVVSLLDGSTTVSLESGVMAADWSRDGNLLLAQAREECAADLFVVDVQRGDAIRVVDAPSLGHESSTRFDNRWKPFPRVSPDGRNVVFARPRTTIFANESIARYSEVDVWHFALDKGVLKRLLAADDGQWLVEPTFHPNGESIACISRRVVPECEYLCCAILLMSLNDLNVRTLGSRNGLFHSLQWHPSGRFLSFCWSAKPITPMYAYQFGSQGRPSGQLWAIRISDGAMCRLVEECTGAIWLRNGSTIVVRGGDDASMYAGNVSISSFFDADAGDGIYRTLRLGLELNNE